MPARMLLFGVVCLLRALASIAQAQMFDQIVVGGGITGLWAANELAKSGQKVAIIEQFPRCHHRGGSAGSSRAIELTYPIPGAMPGLKKAIEMYQDLEYETGIEVLKDASVIIVTEQPYNKTPYAEILGQLSENEGVNLPHLQWNELVQSYPGFGFTEESHAILDNVTAKEFLASKAVFALWTALAARGATTVDACPVTKVAAQKDNTVIVECKGRKFYGKSAILSTGAWTGNLDVFASNGTRVDLPRVDGLLSGQIYFKEKEKCPDMGFMDWQFGVAEDMVAWGRPAYNTQTDMDYLIGLGEKLPVSDPTYQETPGFQTIIDKTIDYIRMRMPCLDETPVLIEKAMLYGVNTTNYGPRLLVDGIYLALEGNSFGGAPTHATTLVSMIVGK